LHRTRSDKYWANLGFCIWLWVKNWHIKIAVYTSAFS
jgi:hypothetical protein